MRDLRLGVIARADSGGLASQTYEVARNMHAERVLVVDMGVNTRGWSVRPEMYDLPGTKKWITKSTGSGRFGPEVDQFFDGLDIVFTAETAYNDRMYSIARNAGCTMVLHGNPELFYDAHRAADAIWAPTSWEIDRMPARTKLMPMPVALDQFKYRRRTKADTLFFTGGEAMRDRNGSQIVMQSLLHVQRPCHLLIRVGPEPPQSHKMGKVKVEYLPAVDNYWEVIPEEADVLLMPRRYGGLSLPTQEAAAAGIPTIMTNLQPQLRWFPRSMMVPAVLDAQVGMKGGVFPVYTVRPIDMGAKINEMLESPAFVANCSDIAYNWACERSWDALRPQWEEQLIADKTWNPMAKSKRYGRP